MTIILIRGEMGFLETARLPSPVYVCLCNGVTEHDIRQAAKAGCTGISELTMRTGCGATCGSCVSTACAILDEVRNASQIVALEHIAILQRMPTAA